MQSISTHVHKQLFMHHSAYLKDGKQLNILGVTFRGEECQFVPERWRWTMMTTTTTTMRRRKAAHDGAASGKEDHPQSQ